MAPRQPGRSRRPEFSSPQRTLSNTGSRRTLSSSPTSPTPSSTNFIKPTSKRSSQDAEIAKTFNQIDQATRVTVAFTALANDEKSLDLLLRYETTYTRLYQRAMNTLIRLRRENQIDENRPEPITSEELRNDPPPPVAEPVYSPEITPGSPEFAEMITQMSPAALMGYLSSLKSQCEASEPQPESTE